MHHVAVELAWPSAWPEPPKHMSFTTLSAFESCPLRWALSRGKYDGLWSGDGYPPKINSASIIGQVIHRVIETVSFRARSGTGTEFGSRILTVVRNGGGFTKLIDEALHDVLDQYTDNPRAARLLTQYQFGKLQLPATIRTKVQSLLRGLANYPVTSSTSSANFAKSQSRKPLSQGLYSEISLYADQFNWSGKVDLISIATDGTSLEDVKTGVEKDADREQIIVYAWLWWRDDARNPDHKLPTRLSIRYLDRIVDVPAPSESELVKLEQRIVKQTSRMIADIANSHFEPRPDMKTCRYCDVRQLCDAYWREIVGPIEISNDRSIDVEAQFVDAIGTDAWVVDTQKTSSDTSAIYHLRGELPKLSIPAGTTLRILDVVLPDPVGGELNDETPILQLRNYSELFIIP